MTKKDTEIRPDSLGLDDCFNFGCGDHLACFTRCCRSGPNIWITPCDIIRMKKNLGVPSNEFLRLYTRTSYAETAGYPVISLKMREEDGRSCPFSTDKGCAVYPDRPWVCRVFPLLPDIIHDERMAPVVDGPSPKFEVHRVDYCMAFGRGMPVSIRQWREEQGALLYEDVNAGWKKVTHHKDFKKRDFLRGDDADLFHICCYDIDQFRKKAFEEDLFNDLDMEEEEIRGIASDDTELLKFSFRWLRHVMFQDDAS